jgi:hypothetical protein
LDLTVLTHGSASRSVFNEVLGISKKIFPFLGEAHFYSPEHLNWIIPYINAFELKRDPELMYAQKDLRHEEDNVEKFVFLQRMFFSDAHTLEIQPKYRQQKWMHHFKLLNLPAPSGLITQETVKTIMFELIDNNAELRKSFDMWLKNYQRKDFDIYRADLGSAFKIIAPHKYLWFIHDPAADEKFLKDLSLAHQKIIQRQIDWEIWGLYCQRHWTNEKQVIEHLARLIKVKAVIDPTLNYETLLQNIQEIFRDYFKLSRQVS